MPAPSKTWVVIADSQVDADSPLDTTLMTGVRDDLVHLEEWLGDGYTAAKDHDHDGVNSKTAVLADNTVTWAKMTKAQGSYNHTVGGSIYISINQYSHYPHYNKTAGTAEYSLKCETQGSAATGVRRYVFLNETVSGSGWNVTVYWDYHT